MKYIISSLFILLFSCVGKNESEVDFDSSQIEYAELKSNLSDSICVPLTKKQIKQIEESVVDFDQRADLLKAMSKYWLSVRLKNDSVMNFKILTNYFGYHDRYVPITDTLFFKKLYQLEKAKSKLYPVYR